MSDRLPEPVETRSRFGWQYAIAVLAAFGVYTVFAYWPFAGQAPFPVQVGSPGFWILPGMVALVGVVLGFVRGFDILTIALTVVVVLAVAFGSSIGFNGEKLNDLFWLPFAFVALSALLLTGAALGVGVRKVVSGRKRA